MNKLEKKKIVTEAVKAIKKLLPLAEIIESDEFKPEERYAFRDQASQSLYDLSDKLNALLGEEVRASMRGFPRDPIRIF